MYKIILYLCIFFATMLTNMFGQSNDSLQEVQNKYVLTVSKEGVVYESVDKEEAFQAKINRIVNQLDLSIKQNKESLKKDLQQIDTRLKGNEINIIQADSLKNEKATFYATKIDEATFTAERDLKELMFKKVNGELNLNASIKDYTKTLIERRNMYVTSFGFGSSLMLVDGGLNTDMYKTKPISALNWGLAIKRRLLKENSHYYLMVKISGNYNSLKPTEKKVLDLVDNKTVLVDYQKPLKKSRIDFYETRLETYFEYDFSKKSEDKYGNVILKSRQSYFMGVGGFIGFGNNKLTQIMKYKTDGKEHKNKETGNFGANTFVYGVGAYVGHKNVSLSATYNLNPTFKYSDFKHHFLNIGVTLDLI